MEWYQYTKTQLENEFQVDLGAGLSPQRAEAALRRAGPNLLAEPPVPGWLGVFLRQFQSPLIYVLAVCAVIIFFLGQVADAAIIVVVLLVNAVIGAVQEGRAGQILRSLKKLSAASATVLRGGAETIIPEAEVAPGDLLVLKEGQRVTADARVVAARGLTVDEAALTGEAAAVEKRDAVLAEDHPALSERHNMVYKGTAVLAGDGLAVAVGTGMNTEMGKISRALLLPETEMPLQRNIKVLSRFIIYAVLAISAALFVLGMWRGIPARDMFSLVVSLALSIIPEGLPLILTLILVHGVWRMSRHRALVKKLQAVEALGQATVLCVDKTGTITENQMTVERLYTGRKIYHITGAGYQPAGQALLGGRPAAGADIAMAALIGSLAGKASVQQVAEDQTYRVSGDPTEAAMLVFGQKLGAGRDRELEKYRETAELPFSYKTKFHVIFYEHEDRVIAAVAGAPEVVLRRCVAYAENGLQHELAAAERRQAEEVMEE
ncbi:MAG TPA: HAD-IC family P-type ATPase, partial [Patescibacteria group bacterium]|nr:HAD-IC family P-type ATPase [Patescibacteria group bacterium]